MLLDYTNIAQKLTQSNINIVNHELDNYFHGVIKADDISSSPPFFKRKSNEEYKINQENFIKTQKKILKNGEKMISHYKI